MKKVFLLSIIFILLCAAFIHAETPDGCAKFASNGYEEGGTKSVWCDDDDDVDHVVSGGGNFKFTVENNGGGTFFIAESSAIPGRCQDFESFGNSPPFPTVKTLSPSDDGKSVTLPPSKSGTYTLGSYGGHTNRGYLCPGGDGSDAGSGPSDGSPQGNRNSGSNGNGGNSNGGNLESGAASTEPTANLPAAVPGVCFTDTDLDCKRSDLVTSDACKQVVSGLYTYVGCDAQKITLTYNVQTLTCGDELGLRIGKYDGAGGWTPLEDSSVESNGDGTGTVTATINSDAVFAVITTNDCVPQCFDNVFDYPDPVLGGSSVTLGACGSLISADNPPEEKPKETNALPDFDEVAPALFIIRKDECTLNAGITSSDQQGAACPKGYDFSGSFKVGNEEDGCSGTETYEGLAKTNKGYVTAKITQGWVDLCTKNDIAYLENTRDECLVKSYEFPPEYAPFKQVKTIEIKDNSKGSFFEGVLEAVGLGGAATSGFQSVPGLSTLFHGGDADPWHDLYYGVTDPNALFAGDAHAYSTLYCPEGKVLCGVADWEDRCWERSDNPFDFSNGIGECLDWDIMRRDYITKAYCCDLNIKVKDPQDNSDNVADPEGVGSSAYCTEKNSIATGAGFADASEARELDRIDMLTCSKATGVTIDYTSKKKLVTKSDVDDTLSLFCNTRYGPDYALCGGEYNSNYELMSTVYCCQIKQNLPCKDGYSLVGSIKVNNDNPLRCDTNQNSSLGTYGVSADGRTLTSGFMGVCVKDSALEQFKNAISLIPESVQEGNVATTNPAENDIKIGTLTLTGDYDGVILNQLTANSQDTDSSSDSEEQVTVEPTVQIGTIGFYLKPNYPLVSFCAQPDFANGTCSEELCTSTDGTFVCEATTTVEDAVHDYYGFICDFTGCPSVTFKGVSDSYYGKGSYQVCSSSESCGLVGVSSECIDVDQDGYCTTGTQPDCDDNNIAVNPGAIDICDGLDNNCDLAIDENDDTDMDGVSTCATTPDCDDTNSTIAPGLGELCGNGIDEDCDGEAPACPACLGGTNDTDMDGQCSDLDCNDNNNTIYLNATDICGDGIDQDCDGNDAQCPQCTVGTYRACFSSPENTLYTYHQVCNDNELWDTCTPDYELGVPPPNPAPACTDGQVLSCPRQMGVCAGSVQICSGSSWPGCNYANIQSYSTTDTCGDYLDNDCDGSVDEGCACITGQETSCGSDIGECSAGTQTCSNGKWGSCQDQTEPVPEMFLDQKDNDCDGSIDEGFDCSQNYGLGFSRSCGGPSIGICKSGIQTCTDKLFDGLTVLSACVGAVNPHTEICNDLDDDCDGSVDEGCGCSVGQTKTCGLGIGICTTGSQICSNGTFTACQNVTLPKEEKCGNSLDDDCDGTADEDCACNGNQTTTLCTKQFGVCNGTVSHCVNGKFEDCNAIYGNLSKYQPLENACSDGLDNDCDNKTDDLDPTTCDDSSSSSLRCSDGTLLNTCVNKGKSPIFCNSNGQLVELCSTCDPTCEPGSTTCDIQGRCVVEKKQIDDGNTDYIPPDDNTPPTDTGSSTSDKGSSWSTYLIIGLIILALIALVFIFMKMRKKKDTPKTPLTPMQIHAIERPAITQKDLKEVKAANNTNALKEYIHKCLTQGKKISEVRELCKKAGWTDAEINAAMPATSTVPKINPNDTLEHYVVYSFKRGMKDTEIRGTLIKAGWKAPDVDKAILNGKLALAREVGQNISDQQKRKEELNYADKKLDEMTKKKK